MIIEKNIPIPVDSKRMAWPWKDMQVGDCVKFDDKKSAGKAQAYCHVYGTSAGKKFVTKTIDGVMHIWRTA